jgi:hypothetical protein
MMIINNIIGNKNINNYNQNILNYINKTKQIKKIYSNIKIIHNHSKPKYKTSKNNY